MSTSRWMIILSLVSHASEAVNTELVEVPSDNYPIDTERSYSSVLDESALVQPQECLNIPWANDVDNCLNDATLGCVSSDPRPLALADAEETSTTMLTNKGDKICYVNSAITALFAGGNDFVPNLQDNALTPQKMDPQEPCNGAVRMALRHIVRAMRNQPTVDENDYVLNLIHCVNASCDGYAPLWGQGGEGRFVLEGLFLPALKLSHRVYSPLSYKEGFSLESIHNSEPDIELVDMPDVLMIQFEGPPAIGEARVGTYFGEEVDLRELADEFASRQTIGGCITTATGATYILRGGTSARIPRSQWDFGHEVGWTVDYEHGDKSANMALTVYNDERKPFMIPFGIKKFHVALDGFKFLEQNYFYMISAVFKAGTCVEDDEGYLRPAA